jgi:hypothetical protein
MIGCYTLIQILNMISTLKTPNFGVLNRHDSLPWREGSIMVEGRSVAFSLAQDNIEEDKLTTKKQILNVSRELGETLNLLISIEPVLRNVVAKRMAESIADWHHSDEGEITPKILHSKMCLSHIYLYIDSDHLVSYLVDSIPAPYEITLVLDNALNVIDVTAS